MRQIGMIFIIFLKLKVTTKHHSQSPPLNNADILYACDYTRHLSVEFRNLMNTSVHSAHAPNAFRLKANARVIKATKLYNI